MASPVDAGRLGTNGSTAATNKACNLPASIAANDVLLLILRSAGADTHTTPTDWLVLDLNNVADASDDTTSVWYKIATGSEGGSVTVNGTASLKFAAMAWRITGGTTPEINPAVTGASTTPDPGANTPSGGSGDYLFVWLGGWEGEQTSPPASQPINYSTPVGANSGVGGQIATNCRVAGATRAVTGTSEDPPSWTISVTDQWTAWTVSVGPPPPAPPGPSLTLGRMLGGIG